VAVLAAAVLAVAFLFASQGGGPASSALLDPRNPSADGAQALARVLQSQGVKVDIARGQAELERAGADTDTTVFVARTGLLAQSTTNALGEIASNAERLVLLAPDRTVLRDLAPDVSVVDARRAEGDLVASGCNGTTDVRPGETLSRSQMEYKSTLAAAACFTHDGSSVYLALARRGPIPPMVLLGSTSAPANDQITEASNAAVMLRVLGHSGRVVWYIPSREDLPAGDTGLASLLPRWLGPVLALGGVAFLGLVLWRGRRFGRLVPEPLPVVVRAVETTESRGRLYRRARDSARAGATLQQATRIRLADYLGLPRPSATISSRGADQALVSAVASASGRRVDEVGALLLGPPPARDDHLLGLAAELAALEKEVRRS
jgi:hypothetical protein